MSEGEEEEERESEVNRGGGGGGGGGERESEVSELSLVHNSVIETIDFVPTYMYQRTVHVQILASHYMYLTTCTCTIHVPRVSQSVYYKILQSVEHTHAYILYIHNYAGII